MRGFAYGLARTWMAAILLVAAGARASAQLPEAPEPTLGPAGACPAVARFEYDVSSIAGADRVLWQLRRGTANQGFAAATEVDEDVAQGASGSVERDLRDFGPVLDGTRYFFRVRARQGATNLSEFSPHVRFDLDLSPDGMFTASPGSSPESVRIDWTLTGAIAACADRVVVRVLKADGTASVTGGGAGASGGQVLDVSAHGPGDYDVRVRAGFGSSGDQDAVGRESAPVRVTVAAVAQGPELSIDDVSFPEGNAGNTRNAVVRLSAPASQPVSVLVGALPGGTATEGACAAGRDVTFALRTVTIAPGQPQVTVPFTLCGDALQEPDESFSLGLLTPVNATIRDDRGVVTVLNDDAPTPPAPPAPLNVSIRDAPFTEGNGNNTQLAVVRLSASTNQPVTVLIGARPGGTATEGSCAAGRDFTFAFRSVTINPGRTELNVPFTLCGDTVFENDETFSLGLTSAVNAALGDSVGTMTIRNDDPTPAEGTGQAQRPELPNLQVTIDERPQFETQQGPLLVHVFTVRNTGAGPASNVQVQSTLPRDVRFLRVEANQFDGCTGGVITDAATGQALVRCTASSLPAGASRLVRIVGEVAGATAIPDSTRVVFGVNVDPNRTVVETSESDNFAFLSTIVRLPSDVQVAVKQVSSGSGDLFFEGGICSRDATVTVLLTVTNRGPFISRATTVSGAWPAVFEPAGLSCFDTCNVKALGPGESTVGITFKAFLPTALGQDQRATFTVDPAGTLLDPILANNTITPVVCE